MKKNASVFTKTERLTVSGMLLAVGILLPYVVAHGIGLPGNILLPMHIPVFICGLLCGPVYGAACGLILPLLNSLISSMPALYPNMPMMAAELFTYGLVSGILYNNTPLGKRRIGTYVSLVVSMLCGRVSYAAAFNLIYIFDKDMKAAGAFSAFVTGLPGIAIQLLVVPGVVFAVEGYFKKSKRDALQSAKNLIARDKATCVVIKNDRIVNIEHGSGIAPIISLYDEGLIRDAVVVDKKIGKAAAMILALGGVRSCYGVAVSRSAVEFMESVGIPLEFERCTDHIVNRTGDGVCPMEKAVADISDPEEALLAVRATLKALSEKK